MAILLESARWPDKMPYMTTSDIRVSVSMNDEGIQDIRWEADDALETASQQAKAMILALWDGVERNAMRIDLWTVDMTVEDMNDFVFQTLISLAESYGNATGNKSMSAELKIFAREFAEKASQVEGRQSPLS
jgi:gliding motility-associated protein GldC